MIYISTETPRQGRTSIFRICSEIMSRAFQHIVATCFSTVVLMLVVVIITPKYTPRFHNGQVYSSMFQETWWDNNGTFISSQNCALRPLLHPYLPCCKTKWNHGDKFKLQVVLWLKDDIDKVTPYYVEWVCIDTPCVNASRLYVHGTPVEFWSKPVAYYQVTFDRPEPPVWLICLWVTLFISVVYLVYLIYRETV